MEGMSNHQVNFESWCQDQFHGQDRQNWGHRYIHKPNICIFPFLKLLLIFFDFQNFSLKKLIKEVFKDCFGLTIAMTTFS
jgi:hypothetical protein